MTRLCICLLWWCFVSVHGHIRFFRKSSKHLYDESVQLAAKHQYQQAIAKLAEAHRKYQNEKEKSMDEADIFYTRAQINYQHLGYSNPLISTFDYLPKKPYTTSWRLSIVTNDLKTCLRIDLFRVDCIILLADCLARKYDYESAKEALELMENVVQVERDDPRIHSLHSRIQGLVNYLKVENLLYAGRQNVHKHAYREGIELYTKALKIAHDRWDFNLYYHRAQAFVELEEYANASKDALKAVQLAKAEDVQIEAKILHAKCLHKQGQNTRALVLLTEIKDYLLSGVYFVFGKNLLPDVEILIDDIQRMEANDAESSVKDEGFSLSEEALDEATISSSGSPTFDQALASVDAAIHSLLKTRRELVGMAFKPKPNKIKLE